MVKKIAVVTPVFPPYGGGIGRVAREDALILSLAGNKVVVFAPCKHTRSFLKFGNAAILLELFWKLRCFDVIHLHYPFFGTAEIIWVMKKLRILKSKLVITYHMDVVGSSYLGKFFIWHTKYLMPRILKSADKIIVTSFDYIKHSNAKSIFEKYPEKLEEIPIGVDDNFFTPREKDKKLMSKFGIQENEKIILFVGGLDKAHYFKGISYLLKSFKILVGNRHACSLRLVIVGDGELRSRYELEAKNLGIKDKVVFAGAVSREDLPKYYNLADVFVLPSIDKSEAFGIVILEAMASGAPIIASNLHGVRTLIHDGKNGFLVEPKNIEDLSDKINRVLSNSDLVKRMGECGRRIIEEKYNYKKVGEKLTNFYSTVIPASQSGIHTSSFQLRNLKSILRHSSFAIWNLVLLSGSWVKPRMTLRRSSFQLRNLKSSFIIWILGQAQDDGDGRWILGQAQDDGDGRWILGQAQDDVASLVIPASQSGIHTSVIPASQSGIHTSVIPASQSGIHKIKICLINNLYKPYSRGGAEGVVEIIEDGLKKQGHRVFVISSNPTFPLNLCWYRDLSKHGMIFRLFWHFFDMFNLHSFFRVRKILKEKKPDIVWTHNLKGLGYLIPFAIKLSGIKHIHTLHDVQLSTPSGLIIKGQENSLEQTIFLRVWYEKICRWLFGSPDIVISPSKWLMGFYEKKGFFNKSKKMVIPNPTPVIPAKAGIHTDSITNLGDDRIFNILYLGQIEEHKGVLFAIKTLKKIINNNLRFHVVGDGAKLEEVKQLTKEDSRFIIYGRKIGEELEEIWKKINLTIVPSLCYENLPTVILDSFAHNIPVLASNIGGIGELVSEDFLFEPNDSADFLKKINWCLEHKDAITKEGARRGEFIKKSDVENYIAKAIE